MTLFTNYTVGLMVWVLGRQKSEMGVVVGVSGHGMSTHRIHVYTAEHGLVKVRPGRVRMAKYTVKSFV